MLFSGEFHKAFRLSRPNLLDNECVEWLCLRGVCLTLAVRVLYRLFAAFCAVLLLAACDGLGMIRSIPVNRVEVESFIGARIPFDAVNIYTAGEAALETIVLARFELPRENLVDFLSDLGASRTLNPDLFPFETTAAPIPEAADWWQLPENGAGDFSGLSEALPNGRELRLLAVTAADDERLTIFLQMFST